MVIREKWGNQKLTIIGTEEFIRLVMGLNEPRGELEAMAHRQEVLLGIVAKLIDRQYQLDSDKLDIIGGPYEVAQP